MSNIKLSYGITVCNELEEIKTLISFLHIHKRPEDEICVLLDKPKASPILVDQLYKYSSNDWIKLKESIFQNHFADWKNELTGMCSGEYVFNIDADELPHINLIKNLPEILDMNNNVDVMLVPRINTVEGLTQQHIRQWRWIVNEKRWVNFPDYQMRIYKNASHIRWVNKVHEVLEGFETHSMLPSEEKWALYHPKTIERQERQNNYYDTL